MSGPLDDRCDACGCEAHVIASRGDLRLSFCGHHGRALTALLCAQGWVVGDATVSSGSPAADSPSPAPAGAPHVRSRSWFLGGAPD